MNRQKLLNSIKEKQAISPIIATLLLILIAIAAGVIVYAYVIGFVGGSTTNNGGNASVISVDDLCAASTTGNCGAGNQFSIVVRNVGTTSISITSPSSEPALYFTDVTSSISATPVACSAATASVKPSSTYTCSGTWPAGFAPSPGDAVSVKIVNPDGGSAPASTKVLS